MSLIAIGAILLGIALLLIAVVPKENSVPRESRTMKLTVALRRGDMECTIWYEETGDPIMPTIERSIRRWAISLPHETYAPGLMADQLEAILANEYPDFHVRVIDLQPSVPAPTVEKKIDRVETAMADIKQKEAVATAIASTIGLTSDMLLVPPPRLCSPTRATQSFGGIVTPRSTKDPLSRIEHFLIKALAFLCLLHTLYQVVKHEFGL